MLSFLSLKLFWEVVTCPRNMFSTLLVSKWGHMTDFEPMKNEKWSIKSPCVILHALSLFLPRGKGVWGPRRWRSTWWKEPGSHVEGCSTHACSGLLCKWEIDFRWIKPLRVGGLFVKAVSVTLTNTSDWIIIAINIFTYVGTERRPSWWSVLW